jgi:hypothetical protein
VHVSDTYIWSVGVDYARVTSYLKNDV